MTRNRSAATLIVLVTLAASPAGASAASSPSPLAPSPPAWLLGRATATTSTTTTQVPTTPVPTTPVPTTASRASRAGAGLPSTGADLLTDGIVALALVATGGALRIRPGRRRF